jgi:hypothetical protein
VGGTLLDAMMRLRAIVGRMGERVRARPWASATMALVGLGIGLLIVTNLHNRTIPAWDVALILVGGTLLALVTSTFVTGSSQVKLASDFWEAGALGRFAIAASFCACASLFWGMALAIMFGTLVR